MDTKTPTRSPLDWPEAWPRTEAPERSRFGSSQQSSYGNWKERRPLTVARAMTDLYAELERHGAEYVVVSTNLILRRLDGGPRSGQKEPEDAGVAVYFTVDGEQRCFPCDRWDRVADNIRAITKTLDAIRAIERWGARSMTAAAFSGFKALPEKAGGVPWWEVLEVDSSASADEITAAYKAQVRVYHPDIQGTGDADKFRTLVDALRQARDVVR